MKSLAFYSDGILHKLAFFLVGAAVGGYFIYSPVNIALFALVFGVCASEAMLGRKKPPKRNPRYDAACELLLNRSDRSLQKALLSVLDGAVDNGDFVSYKGKALVVRFRYSPLNADECVAIADKLGSAVVLCHSADASARTVAKSLGLKLVDGYGVCRILEKYSCLPQPEKGRSSFRSRLKKALNRRRSGALFLCSAVLLLSARFSPMSVYYLVCSAACFALAVAASLMRAED